AVFTAVPVVRATDTPLTGMSDVAETTVVPVAAEVIVTWQNAVAPPPTYVHWFEPTKLPGPDTIVAVAVCGPASIVPLSAFTVIVSTWFAPTGFVAVAGLMLMFPSTHVLVAGPELSPAPSVFRDRGMPSTVTEACALTTVAPVVDEVSVIWQLPVPPEVVHGFEVVKFPGPLSIVKAIDVPSGALT